MSIPKLSGNQAALLVLASTVSLSSALPKPDPMGVTETGPYDYGVMGPPATPEIVAAAQKAISTPMPAGPFEPAWDSIRRNYRVPSWFEDAKFGIFIHWGLYSVPAHRGEWYQKHMYSSLIDWHTRRFGPPETFGYKDFIPLFKAEKWNPSEWAALFRKCGARLVMPCAQHHDNFALWDSAVTRYNSVNMGPRRDLVGELAAAVRAKGLKFGVSNHGIENFTFIDPPEAVLQRLRAANADLFDPQWSAFYNVADRGDAAMSRFLTDWAERNFELIDKYRPDILWFDNGANLRLLDPLKLRVAAHYYNRARQWSKEVAIGAKFVAFAPSNKDGGQVGAIIDFEKAGHRSPAGIRPGPWMVDDPIGTTWGYTADMRIFPAASILGKLVDTVSKGGFYLLNISPMADGSIPADQREVLLSIGSWLDAHGEAIYGTRPWMTHAEDQIRFTSTAGALYAVFARWPGEKAHLKSLAKNAGVAGIEKVELLAGGGALRFVQTDSALEVELPRKGRDQLAYVLKISGNFPQPPN